MINCDYFYDIFFTLDCLRNAPAVDSTLVGYISDFLYSQIQVVNKCFARTLNYLNNK